MIAAIVFLAVLYGLAAFLVLTIPRQHPGHDKPADDEKEG
jgi:hypothetical protein